MERQRTAAMSRTAFAAEVIGFLLIGTAFLVGAVLVFSGTVTVVGAGEGTIAQRVVVGLLALALGGVCAGGAILQLKQGRRATRPAPPDTRSDNGPGARGFGIESPERRHDDPGPNPAVGEF
ncbi:hypothetical protein ACIBSW_35580 [Actinoplanes sp. NPDC049668]|uniref:hypothetical protein n=1 Tax=unclassified Actinoplanes TaxID=2626549 RepID=UPI0033AA7D14